MIDSWLMIDIFYSFLLLITNFTPDSMTALTQPSMKLFQISTTSKKPKYAMSQTLQNNWKCEIRKGIFNFFCSFGHILMSFETNKWNRDLEPDNHEIMNILSGSFRWKHCQRHNGPEGWVHITSSNTNLDQISSSESRPSINFKITTKHQPLHKT